MSVGAGPLPLAYMPAACHAVPPARVAALSSHAFLPGPAFLPLQASESFEIQCDHVLAATGKPRLPFLL